MREPNIAIGFIIFREGCEEQLPSGGLGHWRTARNWVENSRFNSEFIKVINDPTNNIHDYDDFLTDYVGAIRLYFLGGCLHCYIPRGNNNEYKSYLKNFYMGGKVTISGKDIKYELFGDIPSDLENTSIEKKLMTIYNQIVIQDETGRYIYNPNRIGD